MAHLRYGRTRWLAALVGLLSALVPLSPARALEEVEVELPLIQSTMRVRLSELNNPESLRGGHTELAELDRATDGKVGQALLKLLNHRLPLSISQMAQTAVGSPLLEQALLLVSSLGTVEGRPADLTGETLELALRKAVAAAPDGQPTLLQLMQAIPGHRVRLNLSLAGQGLKRMLEQRSLADQLLARAIPAAVAPPSKASVSASSLRRSILQLPVKHRSDPLQLLLIEPTAKANGRLVLISHGLWDSPESFEGWARRLAARGYTVVLPWHPGSDKQQQSEVLTGKAPPPTPQELGLRARDLTAVLDGVASGQLKTAAPVDTSRVVVLGHSWGATTSLQLAGLVPTESKLLSRCGDVSDAERNLSWTLQCSWASGVSQAAVNDDRVIAVVAVSPPMSLLFPRESGHDLNTRVLLVSGSRDWVVPPDPEAIRPLQVVDLHGHQLVLVKGGDHFNLRPRQNADGGVLGPLIQAWTDAAFAAGQRVKPGAGVGPLLLSGAWGSVAMPMADVSPLLPSSR